MNKQEILFKLSDTADRLESAGLLREAIVLTNVMKRMAQDYDDQYEYEYAINELRDLYWAGFKSGQYNNEEINKVYKEYINKLDEQIRQTSDPNLQKELKKRKQAFTLQTNRLVDVVNTKSKPKPDGSYSTGIRLHDNMQLINQFGLEKATDLKDYNRRWQLFMDYLKKGRWSSDPQNPKTIYYQEGMQPYLQKLYEQLKLKYIK
jgi:hypothetical protein